MFSIKLDNVVFWKYQILSKDYEGRALMKFDIFKKTVYFKSEKHHTMFRLMFAEFL